MTQTWWVSGIRHLEPSLIVSIYNSFIELPDNTSNKINRILHGWDGILGWANQSSTPPILDPLLPLTSKIYLQ